MERRKKELIAWAILVCSITLVAYSTILLPGGGISAAIFTALCVVFLMSLLAVIKYSEGGRRVEGSTVEWIVTAVVSPFLALALHFVSRRQSRRETTDLRDNERFKEP